MNTGVFQVDPALEAEAQAVLQKLGLTLTDAVNMFLRETIFEQALPFAVNAPDRFTEAELLEKHDRGVRQYHEGHYVVKTMEELEAMARDGQSPKRASGIICTGNLRTGKHWKKSTA